MITPLSWDYERLDQLQEQTNTTNTVTNTTTQTIKQTTKQTTTNNTKLPAYITSGQKVLISGFPEESIATYVATNYYRQWWLDMVTTMLVENGWFNIYSKSPNNDYWLCQRHYDSSTKAFIDSPDFYNVDVQMNECIRLRNATKLTWRNKTKWAWYRLRNSQLYKISIVDIAK